MKKASEEKKPAEEPMPHSDVETTTNDNTIVQSRLPTLRELLPPVFQPNSENGTKDQAPIRLDSRDPRYSDYLRRVKQALNLAWYDPTVARSAVKPYGIDGKLVVRFTPGDNGDVEELYITHTSGYAVLDQEALRVVAAAAPHFGRPPRSSGKHPIDVTFIYEKDSVSYSFAPR